MNKPEVEPNVKPSNFYANYNTTMFKSLLPKIV